MLTDNYIFDALQAEREGVAFPVEFDATWEAFGFKTRNSARQYFRRNAETFVKLGIMQNPLQAKCSNNELTDFDKYSLSIKGFKFSLARAKTEKGAEYLLHLLDIEEKYLASLERALDIDIPESPTKPPFPYTLEQLHQWSGYAHFWYTRQVLKEDYEPGADYIAIENKIYVSIDTAYIFLIVARPELGTTIPEEIRKHPFPWAKFQELVAKKKKNRCRSCSKYVSPGQTKLF